MCSDLLVEGVDLSRPTHEKQNQDQVNNTSLTNTVALGLVVLLVATSGCTGFVMRSGPPETIVTEELPEAVAVDTDSETGIILYDPHVEGDSLVGQRLERVGNRRIPNRTAIAVNSIQSLGTEEALVTRSIVLGLGAAGAAAALVLLAASATR
jgi:hypothetical protein